MKKIILIGMKACGKTTVGKILSERLNITFVELDNEIEKRYFQDAGRKFTCREIFEQLGNNYFRNLETTVLDDLSKILAGKSFIFSCGGGTPMKNQNRKILKRMGKIIFLDTDKGVILERIMKNGIPSFFPKEDNPEIALNNLLMKRVPVYKSLAEITIQIAGESPEGIASKITKLMNI